MGRSPDRCGAPADAPLALTEARRCGIRIAATDAHAQKLGIEPGMTLADARARVPELAALAHDPIADAALIDRLADACERYSPMVAIDPPDTILIDITGAAHPYGDEGALAQDALARLAAIGIAARAGIAASPEGAWALARFQTTPSADEAGALKRLPIAALRLDDEAETSLRRAGLRTVGDLAARPVKPLAARFGADSVAMLNRLLGRADSRISPRRPLPAIRVDHRTAEPILHLGGVTTVLSDLAGRACAELAERARGGRRFVLTLYRCDGATRSLEVSTSLPLRDPAGVLRLFDERIASLADPIDPGFGFDQLRLDVPRIEPLAPTQLGLDGGAVADDALAALVDRLSTRAGKTRVRRFVPRDSHVPEQGVLALAAIDAPAPAPAAWAVPAGEPPLRPLHLFDPPQRIAVMAEVPDGPPFRFRWRRSLHEVRRYEGPERIADPWWQRDGDAGLTRDYYRVEDGRGRRFWIFRHGLYGEEHADPAWYVHGLFA